MQVSSIRAYSPCNYSTQARRQQVSFGELDGGCFDHYYQPYVKKVTIPRDKNDVELNIYTYSPRENKNVLYDTYSFQVKKSERRSNNSYVEDITVPADKSDVELKIYTYGADDWKSSLNRKFKFTINRARLW